MKKFVYRMIILISMIMQTVICFGLIYHGKWYITTIAVAFLPILIIIGLAKMKEEPKEDALYWFFTPLSLYLMSKGTSEWLYITALLNYCITAIIYICFVIAAIIAKKKAKK